MSDGEGFLRRWSRLKHRAAAQPAIPAAPAPVDHPPAPAAAGPAVELPPVESLTFDSDYSAFLGEHVAAATRKAALKKLFHAEEFNRMDGLDVYIDDYGKFEPIDEATLKQLAHARELLFGGADEPSAEHSLQGPAAAAEPATASGPLSAGDDPAQADGSADAVEPTARPADPASGSDNSA